MADATQTRSILDASDTFIHRHIGPSARDIDDMLAVIGCKSLDELIRQSVPESIRMKGSLKIGPARGEHELIAELRRTMAENRVFRSMIGMGYHGTIVPPVVQRNILENPGWYTQYTPYQAEIAQGRLEALLNFQTMICDLTALPVANASMLDEGTAAAEAMNMCNAALRGERKRFHVADDCHPQTIAVVKTRAESLDIEITVGPADAINFDGTLIGILLQYPTTDGRVINYESICKAAHDAGTMVVIAADLLALTLLRPPGEFGADIAIGSAQRFGVPMGYGGPHAAFLATRDEHKRLMPGRLVGVSRDATGRPACRLSIQTREQHIRREKATSNICTAQVLLAVMAGMYAVYHGPDGLRRIAHRVHAFTSLLANGLRKLGCKLPDAPFFDTLRVRPGGGCSSDNVLEAARQRNINLRDFGDGSVGIALDETTTRTDVAELLWIFGDSTHEAAALDKLLDEKSLQYPDGLARQSGYLTHVVFNSFHSESDMLRYMYRLQGRDLSLTHSMIPLGSCTMKLNGTSEMVPVTWPEVGNIHPFAPLDQTRGYAKMFEQLERWLSDITGFAATSLQPNAGSQGEYAGLLTIRAYHAHHNNGKRDICLIPTSAHGTNPASAVIAGMRVVPVACDNLGNIDLDSLRAKATEHAAELAALMITYPSTHGVFEETIRDICDIVHKHGGLVYMDGANMNAQVGLCRPGDIGADVCHLNLHKTFCIPHGGGGPGMGPICVNEKLKPFLPSHPVLRPDSAGEHAIGPISAAPYGSASILPISWVYIALMGSEGLRRASEVAILNANYMAKRLAEHFPVLYTGRNGRVAHEFILDMRGLKKSAEIEVEDIAKRLMDYGFHAPTMSWPVAGTLMIEPTESESKAELDRLCDALIGIRNEIAAIERGEMDKRDNPLKNAPHPAHVVLSTEWTHGYSREQAAFPAAWVRENKFWPAVARIDNVWGDRNLVCTCPPMESYAGV